MLGKWDGSLLGLLHEYGLTMVDKCARVYQSRCSTESMELYYFLCIPPISYLYVYIYIHMHIRKYILHISYTCQVMAKFINHYINQTLLYSWSVSTFMWVVLP